MNAQIRKMTCSISNIEDRVFFFYKTEVIHMMHAYKFAVTVTLY